MTDETNHGGGGDGGDSLIVLAYKQMYTEYRQLAHNYMYSESETFFSVLRHPLVFAIQIYLAYIVLIYRAIDLLFWLIHIHFHVTHKRLHLGWVLRGLIAVTLDVDFRNDHTVRITYGMQFLSTINNVCACFAW